MPAYGRLIGYGSAMSHPTWPLLLQHPLQVLIEPAEGRDLLLRQAYRAEDVVQLLMKVALQADKLRLYYFA